MKLLNPSTGERLVTKIKLRVFVENEMYEHFIIAPHGSGFDRNGVTENLQIFETRLKEINPTWAFQCVKTGFGCYNFIGIAE